VQDCTKFYTDPSSLRKHIKTQHGDNVYDIAKENKTKSGRGGNYGFIPSHIANKNPSQQFDPDMSSTSRSYDSGHSTSNSASSESPDNNSPNSPPISPDTAPNPSGGNPLLIVILKIQIFRKRTRLIRR
jgi:hypothetical protein